MSVTVERISYTSSIDPELTDLRATVAYRTGATALPLLVVMHGWRESVADFDRAALERFASGQWLNLAGSSGSFTAGEHLTGSRSGVKATVVSAVHSPAMHRLTVGLPDGRFEAGEIIRGHLSGATATVEQRIDAATFALFVEMRGRGGSSGQPDGGGREIQDIVDAVSHVLLRYPTQTDPTQLHAVGYSGGGGNVFALAARFPDRFNSLTAHFGISDYGYDPVEGWYFQGANPAQRTFLDAWIGDPHMQRARYHARASVRAISNYRGGFLRMYHDVEDQSTPVSFSRSVAAALDAAGLSHYALAATGPDDEPRALHGLPTVGRAVTLFEPEWMSAISCGQHPPWNLPPVGTLQVIGWVETRGFMLWLRDGQAATGTVCYDLWSCTFIINVEQGPLLWRLGVKGQTPGAEVTAVINGRHYGTTADARGIASFAP